jgi:N-acetylneuraminic acid mutarotase
MIVLTTCNKEFVETGYPSIVTLPVISNTGGELLFSGKIVWRKPAELNELGFLWQTGEDPLVKNGFRLNIGSKTISGNFQTKITTTIKKGAKYFVRAYALCGKTKIYGEIVEFVAGADLPLKLLEFIPVKGLLGDTIKITGNRFNNTLAYNEVKFDTLSALITSVNDSVLKCIVPLQLRSRLSTIKVITNGIEGVFDEKFTLLEPIITSLSSDKIKYGSTLTIYGMNFNTTPGLISVLITGNSRSYTLTPILVKTDSIKVEIYNHQDPTQLLSLSSFTVNIKTLEKTISYNLNVSIIGSWNRVADLPGNARYKTSAFSVGGNCYIGGGASSVGPLKDLWKYNPVTDSWSRMADFPGMARVYPSAFSNQTNGFLGAGYSTDNSSRIQLYDFYKYDPQSNTWSSIANYPDNIMNYYVGYAVTVNDRPFISLSNQLLTMRELANDSWNSFATIPDMIDCPAVGVFSISRKFYVVVGNRINNSVSNAVWEYNSDNQTWTKKSNFPGAARYAPAAFSIDNYGYYGCGMSTTSQQFKDIWRYDPAIDKWIRIEDFPGGIRSHLIGMSAGKAGFMGLGLDFSGPIYYSDFWKYDPK